MTTRFSPSLNGSLHIGHLWMAWFNYAWAKENGGRYLLRFDDLAPKFCGEDMALAPNWAEEGQHLLELAGLAPDGVTYLSDYGIPDFPECVGGLNRWLRAKSLEGWDNIPCRPVLVAARAYADTVDRVDVVIRGEELAPELQLYEFMNYLVGGQPRRLVYLPRLRVRVNGELTTISKTHGNLQLRDLYKLSRPSDWVERVKEVGLLNPKGSATLENINPDPILEVHSLCC